MNRGAFCFDLAYGILNTSVFCLKSFRFVCALLYEADNINFVFV